MHNGQLYMGRAACPNTLMVSKSYDLKNAKKYACFTQFYAVAFLQLLNSLASALHERCLCTAQYVGALYSKKQLLLKAFARFLFVGTTHHCVGHCKQQQASLLVNSGRAAAAMHCPTALKWSSAVWN